MDGSSRGDDMLKAVCTHWITKIEHAKRHKKTVFQEDADECMAFYNGPKNWDDLMHTGAGLVQKDILPETTFKMRVNKAFELVTIFAPTMVYQNPVRTVSLREQVTIDPTFFPDPYLYQAIVQQETVRLSTDQLKAQVVEAYLNFLPSENDLAGESRKAIEEALIKGRGCLWTELYTPPGCDFTMPRSTFDSVDDLLIDPDANSLEEATWIARRCIHPVWQVERDRGLKPGTLKGNMESQALQTEVAGSASAQYDRKRGLTNDLITYWKIWSKMGIGGRLSGINKKFRGPLELFGDFVYLEVARDVSYPLNLPPDVQAQEGFEQDPSIVTDRVQWPTPYWADGAWPVSCLDFHKVPMCPWPMSHLKAGLGELKFLNWAMSFLAGKLRNTTRDFIAIKKEAGEEIKTNILEGRDLTLLELEANGQISELVQFLQHPEVNGDIWKLISAVEANFDKRVGLNELMYGEEGATQIRSAQEASIRNQNMSVRPDDMSKQVEGWMSEVAAKEAIAARLHLSQDDITPALGQVASGMWMQFVASQDLNEVCRGLSYRIEAGSAKKPNKDTQVSQASEGMQTLLPFFTQYATTTGDVQPINNLIQDWAKARDLDPNRYLLQPMPVAPPMPPGGDPNQDPNAQPQQAA